MCVYATDATGECLQKRVSDPLELKLQVLLHNLMWVLRTKLRSSTFWKNSKWFLTTQPFF